MAQGRRVRALGWRTAVLAVLAALVLLGLDASGPERATAQTGGQGVFSLDKTEYETVEGQAVLVTVRRTDGGILTQGVDVQLALSPGGHSGSGTGFDWPPSDEVKLLSFPAGTNLTQQSVYIQTLNQNQYNSRSIHVTIRSISNGGLMGPIWTSPIHLDGTNQPQVLSISPKAADGGAIVTITGRNFVTGSSIANSVTFLPRNGGVPPAGTLVDSFLEPPTPSTLRFFVPSPGLNDFVSNPLVSSSYHLVVRAVKFDDPPAPPVDCMPPWSNATNKGCSRPTSADVFVFTSGPTVTSVSPKEGPAGGGSVIHITGTKFNGVPNTACPAGTVFFQDVFTLNRIEATSCQFTGTNTIRVTTPQRSSGLTHVIVKRTEESPPTVDSEYLFDQGPMISSISPSFGPPDGGTLVTITGSSFGGMIPGGTVRFGSTIIPIVACQVPQPGTGCWISPNELRVISPSDGGASGIRQITVVHPVSGESPFTTNANFTYSTGPLINSITPTFGPVTGGTVVTITGTGFQAGATVHFGSTPATFATVKSQTQIEVISPPGTGNQMIRVTSNGVVSPDTPLASFAYSGPVVTSISPIAGPVAGGTTITIKGQNFTSAAMVQFGPLTAAAPTFVDTQTLTVVAPPHTVPEALHVRVITGSGISPDVPASLYTYTNGPIIDSLNPAAGPTTGGSIVIITGKNFTAPLSISFGTTPALSFNINSATQITVLSPPHSTAEAVDVRLTKGSDVSPVGVATKFTYSSAVPVITLLTPNQGSTVGGYDVVISGLGFTGASCPGAVKFGAVPAATCSVINDTTLAAVAPPNVSGETVVSVTTANGTSAIAVNFTYVSPSSSGGGTSPPAPSPIGTQTYTLTFRWTLLSWGGVDGVSVENVLRGIGTPGGVDIAHRVTAVFEWDATEQAWKAYFPGATGIPGGADFTSFRAGRVYWVAINGSGTLNWIVPAPQ